MKIKRMFLKVKAVLFLFTGVFCILYFLICVAYAGFGLSWIGIWPVFAIFCFVRFFMIRCQIKETVKWHCPQIIRTLYYICFVASLVVFIFVESKVIGCMRAFPEPDLPYVIVLGAGIRGDTPTRPLLLRMKKACDYMRENPQTILIASGGQGQDENLSEAECICNYLAENGIDKSRIILEDRSRSTEENLRNSFALIPEESCRVGIISNGFHIYRALRIANKQGHENVTGIASKTLLPVGIHYTVREFFAIMKLEILG